MPDFNCNVVDVSSRELIEVERFTAADVETMRARLATLQLPDGMRWGEVQPATSRLFAFGVVYVVDGDDPTDAIECAMAEYLNGDLPDDIRFEHIAGPFEFRAELREQVEAPVVFAGTRSTLPRSIEVTHRERSSVARTSTRSRPLREHGRGRSCRRADPRDCRLGCPRSTWRWSRRSAEDRATAWVCRLRGPRADAEPLGARATTSATRGGDRTRRTARHRRLLGPLGRPARVVRRGLPCRTSPRRRLVAVIHYHGTPITPRTTLLQLAGRSFCVSFSAPRDVEVCHEIGESVMLDNGAFSFWTIGRAVDWQRFYAWVGPWLAYRTSWAVIPEVIDGDARANDRLLAAWPFAERGAPVWHPHEPLARLGRLAGSWPRVCIGGSPTFKTMRSPRWHARMRDAMDYLCGSGPAPTWLHLLRGMALAGGDYPFASVDSSSIARNHHGAPSRGTPPRDPLAEVAKTDGPQCPARWRPAVPQLALLRDDHGAHEEPPGRDCVAPAWSAGPGAVAVRR